MIGSRREQPGKRACSPVSGIPSRFARQKLLEIVSRQKAAVGDADYRME
jgi:hypothetical protein